MSLSSSGEAGGGPALHALYDQRQVSEEGSVDSFVIRDIHDRRERARRGEEETETTGFLSSLVSNMRSCCAPSSRKPGYGVTPGDRARNGAAVAGLQGRAKAAAEARKGGNGGLLNTVAGSGGVFGGRRVKTFTSSSSSSSASFARRRDEKGGRRNEESSSGSAVDAAAEDEGDGGGWVGMDRNARMQEQKAAAAGANTAVSATGKPAVLWRITDPGSTLVVLTPAQATWAAVVWCMRLEHSEHMSMRMLQEILQGAEQQKRDVDVTFALQHTPQFQLLVLLRRASGKHLEDLFGDFAAALNETNPTVAAAIAAGAARQQKNGGTAEGGGEDGGGGEAAASAATYMIVARHRVLGIYVRQQGEFIDVGVFDPCPSAKETFPPSFCGFKTIEAMQAYVLGAFAADPREKRMESERINGFILTSKQTFGASPYARNYTTKRRAGKDDWMAREALNTKDPRFEARVMYTNMYRATDMPLDNENVFSLEPGSGMRIQDRSEVEARKQLVKEEQEMEAEHLRQRG